MVQNGRSPWFQVQDRQEQLLEHIYRLEGKRKGNVDTSYEMLNKRLGLELKEP